MKEIKFSLKPDFKGTVRGNLKAWARQEKVSPLGRGRWVIFGGGFLGLCLFAGETFYGSLLSGLFFLPLFPAAAWLWLRQKGKKARRGRLSQFLDGMDAFATALKAGYAAENAVTQSRGEMQLLYGDSSYICKEFKEMERRLRANRPLEETFEQMAKRSGLPPAEELSGILRIVKQNGGDMAETVRYGVRISREKLRLSEEIETLLSGKRYEGKVMKVMPIFVIWMLRLSSPGFLDPLYDTLFGAFVMTGCLLLYGAAWLWEERLFWSCT